MKKKKLSPMTLLEKIAKIESLPKTVTDSLPFLGFTNNGVIETSPGIFTKTYKLPDANFTMGSINEQFNICDGVQKFYNSFEKKSRFQITYFNHEADKLSTLESMRIPPQKDSLNRLRQELNSISLSCLQNGSASIVQDRYLTVAIDDVNAEHAIRTLDKMDIEIGQRIKDIAGSSTVPLSTRERMQLMYDIYNQEMDYRLTTGVLENGEEDLDLAYLSKCGLSVKDIIGPPSLDFAPIGYFQQGEYYAQGLFLERMPASLTTSFLSDLADIQTNMLISLTFEPIEDEAASKMAISQLATIEGRASKVNKTHLQDGYVGALPPELEAAQDGARILINEISGNSQSVFLITFTAVVFAKTKDKLEESVRLVKSVSGKHHCPLKPMRFQQEFVYRTALPLCRNDLTVDLLHTTETASVFIPFNTLELNQKNAIFYGINQSSKRMVLCDRLTGDNFNGLIFGSAGSGKSFIAKFEMVSALLKHHDTQVFVIDPQGEYHPLVKALNGQEIKLSPGSSHYINPLDIDLSEADDEDTDIIAVKVDYVTTLFDIICRDSFKLSPSCKSVIDKCVRKIYRPYIEELQRLGKSSDPAKCPTLTDIYQELKFLERDNPDASLLADSIYQYSVGSFSTFAHRTNVETNARFVVYNTKALGTGMKELGLYICLNDIWNRMLRNSKIHVYTRFYIDEFHILLESEGTTKVLKRIWKMARKWLGVPTGITQNTEDLLKNEDARAIFNNTSFIIIMKEPELDRQNLGLLLNLSDSQLDYITNPEKGYGLLYNGKVIVPFGFKCPKDTELYRIMTTSHDVKNAGFA